MTPTSGGRRRVQHPTGATSDISYGTIGLPGGAWAVYQPTLGLYYHPDGLGSARLQSTPSRTVAVDAAYGPYGETYGTSLFDAGFTGQFWDTVDNLYDFPARRYHPTQGRWISPDPAGLAAVDLTNPQSLNRYAYVLNNPTSLIDLLGLDPQDAGNGCTWDPDTNRLNCPSGPPVWGGTDCIACVIGCSLGRRGSSLRV